MKIEATTSTRPYRRPWQGNGQGQGQGRLYADDKSVAVLRKVNAQLEADVERMEERLTYNRNNIIGSDTLTSTAISSDTTVTGLRGKDKTIWKSAGTTVGTSKTLNRNRDLRIHKQKSLDQRKDTKASKITYLIEDGVKKKSDPMHLAKGFDENEPVIKELKTVNNMEESPTLNGRLSGCDDKSSSSTKSMMNEGISEEDWNGNEKDPPVDSVIPDPSSKTQKKVVKPISNNGTKTHRSQPNRTELEKSTNGAVKRKGTKKLATNNREQNLKGAEPTNTMMKKSSCTHGIIETSKVQNETRNEKISNNSEKDLGNTFSKTHETSSRMKKYVVESVSNNGTSLKGSRSDLNSVGSTKLTNEIAKNNESEKLLPPHNREQKLKSADPCIDSAHKIKGGPMLNAGKKSIKGATPKSPEAYIIKKKGVKSCNNNGNDQSNHPRLAKSTNDAIVMTNTEKLRTSNDDKKTIKASDSADTKIEKYSHQKASVEASYVQKKINTVSSACEKKLKEPDSKAEAFSKVKKRIESNNKNNNSPKNRRNDRSHTDSTTEILNQKLNHVQDPFKETLKSDKTNISMGGADTSMKTRQARLRNSSALLTKDNSFGGSRPNGVTKLSGSTHTSKKQCIASTKSDERKGANLSEPKKEKGEPFGNERLLSNDSSCTDKSLAAVTNNTLLSLVKSSENLISHTTSSKSPQSTKQSSSESTKGVKSTESEFIEASEGVNDEGAHIVSLKPDVRSEKMLEIRRWLESLQGLRYITRLIDMFALHGVSNINAVCQVSQRDLRAWGVKSAATLNILGISIPTLQRKLSVSPPISCEATSPQTERNKIAEVAVLSLTSEKSMDLSVRNSENVSSSGVGCSENRRSGGLYKGNNCLSGNSVEKTGTSNAERSLKSLLTSTSAISINGNYAIESAIIREPDDDRTIDTSSSNSNTSTTKTVDTTLSSAETVAAKRDRLASKARKKRQLRDEEEARRKKATREVALQRLKDMQLASVVITSSQEITTPNDRVAEKAVSNQEVTSQMTETNLQIKLLSHKQKSTTSNSACGKDIGDRTRQERIRRITDSRTVHARRRHLAEVDESSIGMEVSNADAQLNVRELRRQLLQLRREKRDFEDSTTEVVRELQGKLDAILAQREPMELRTEDRFDLKKQDYKTLAKNDRQPDSELRRTFELCCEDITFTENNLLGEGAFCHVFRGTYIGVDVAVKRLKPLAENGERNKLLEEIDVLYKLRHPNIIIVVGACTSSQAPPLLVLELMAGGSLYDRLHSRLAALTPMAFRKLARDMALGLNYLHHLKPPVIHRDLKSHNVLLDASGVAKLGDFGLSRLRIDETSNERTGSVSSIKESHSRIQGALAWMAPEVILGTVQASRYADIWSFGVIIWEMLTCRIPYGDCNVKQILHNVANGELPLIPTATPTPLSNLLLACREYENIQRPSCVELLANLNSLDFPPSWEPIMQQCASIHVTDSVIITKSSIMLPIQEKPTCSTKIETPIVDGWTTGRSSEKEQHIASETPEGFLTPNMLRSVQLRSTSATIPSKEATSRDLTTVLRDAVTARRNILMQREQDTMVDEDDASISLQWSTASTIKEEWI